MAGYKKDGGVLHVDFSVRCFIHPYWFEVSGSIIHMLGVEDVEGMAIHIKCSLIDSGASGISRVGDMVCPYLLFSNGGMPSPVGKFR